MELLQLPQMDLVNEQGEWNMFTVKRTKCLSSITVSTLLPIGDSLLKITRCEPTTIQLIAFQVAEEADFSRRNSFEMDGNNDQEECVCCERNATMYLRCIRDSYYLCDDCHNEITSSADRCVLGFDAVVLDDMVMTTRVSVKHYKKIIYRWPNTIYSDDPNIIKASRDCYMSVHLLKYLALYSTGIPADLVSYIIDIYLRR